jgi:hypothetical protein
MVSNRIRAERLALEAMNFSTTPLRHKIWFRSIWNRWQ